MTIEYIEETPLASRVTYKTVHAGSATVGAKNIVKSDSDVAVEFQRDGADVVTKINGVEFQRAQGVPEI